MMIELTPVLINLKKRDDRLREFDLRWHQAAIPLKYTVFDAFDGSTISMPQSFRASKGALGCTLSHQAVLLDAIRKNVQCLWILEDDCTFVPGFWEKCQTFFNKLPNTWQIAMLGGQNMARPYYTKDGVSMVKKVHRTHSYVVKNEMLGEVNLRMKFGHGHCDHFAGKLHADMQSRGKVFAPDPFLNGQSTSFSDINLRTWEERTWK